MKQALFEGGQFIPAAAAVLETTANVLVSPLTLTSRLRWSTWAKRTRTCQPWSEGSSPAPRLY